MSLAEKLADVFTEPACDKNQAKDAKARKKGCGKPLVPGAAAGGCAFDGAKVVLQPITDAAHLVHGPLACEGNGWDNRGALSSGPALYRTGFTTDLSELDIIMGRGEKRLFKSIREIAEKHRPAAIFVYQTCVPALTGDDIDAVCKAAAERFGLPVIPVNAPGFVGSKNLGNKLAGEALLDHVVGTAEPEFTTPTDINIIGDFNLAGELWQVEPLFARLGIRVLGRLTGDARFAEVASAHRARVNLMVCSMALVNVARKMEERWGIPYAEVSFYGIEDTSEALRACARLLVERGAPADLPGRTEALVREEEAKARAAIARYRPLVAGKRVLLYTGGVKSWSVVSALQELGMVVTGTSVRKSTDGDKARIQEIMGEDAHTFENIPPKEMYRMLKESEADIMLSGGRSQFVALKARTPWLDINQERHRPYAGYDGLVELVRDLATEINNPVWAEVRAPAPWEPAYAEEDAMCDTGVTLHQIAGSGSSVRLNAAPASPPPVGEGQGEGLGRLRKGEPADRDLLSWPAAPHPVPLPLGEGTGRSRSTDLQNARKNLPQTPTFEFESATLPSCSGRCVSEGREQTCGTTPSPPRGEGRGEGASVAATPSAEGTP